MWLNRLLTLIKKATASWNRFWNKVGAWIYDNVYAPIALAGTWIYNHLISPVVNFITGAIGGVVTLFTTIKKHIKNALGRPKTVMARYTSRRF